MFIEEQSTVIRLQGAKTEIGFFVMVNDKIDACVAEVANTVE